ncbi:MAG: hypothetical protein K1X95_16470 [Acidimicrobiia bacterium]|nr:hypothetical protein [Acidimicrobiia bacterium]
MLAKIARIVVPVAGVGVTVFGVLIPSWVEYRREVVNWSAAWAVFDVALGIIVIATWLVARRGHWAAIALAGATNALQGVDVLFSLLLFYDLSERPGILGWAFIVQPVFAILIWSYVRSRVAIPPRGGLRA